MKACPHCDSANLRARNTRLPNGVRTGTGDYYCDDCSSDFDEPKIREKSDTGESRSGLARKLAEIGEENA